jgi:hypothetical protein
MKIRIENARQFAMVAALATALSTVVGTAGAAEPAPSAEQESPFACNSTALSPAERKQHFEVAGPKLLALCRQVRELPDGYEFAFDPRQDTYRLLAGWIYQEHLCCPFFDMSLRIDREGGALRLVLSGREGVKEFIQAEFAPLFEKDLLSP